MSGQYPWVFSTVIDDLLRGQTAYNWFNPADNYYFCLLTGHSETEFESWHYAWDEVSYTGYARQLVRFGPTYWSSTQGDTSSTSTGTSGLSYNLNTVFFPVCTNAPADTYIVSIAIHDSLTGPVDQDGQWHYVRWDLDYPILLSTASPGWRPTIPAGKLGLSIQ